ncbi:CheR family methyltransferase [Pseudaquabacterium rugosum]|uniref:protein-glutamate O-methyltransferase n=1 Tax=Pseudaquabacterium rugosum TaxID=2984194 RepID=A0ABU9BBQ1_9BURK
MISEQAFAAVTGMFHDVSGIHLPASKRALVTGRLMKLAQDRGLDDVDHYVQQLLRERDPLELTRVVDKLTTNETYFFREPEHFTLLARLAAARRAPDTMRVWSAASSSGEEGYSIAMTLADRLPGGRFEVVGTDLSTAMVAHARRGLYTMERARNVPQEYLRRFCRKGHGEYEGMLLIARELRDKVHYDTANLMEPLPELGRFDLIFLRNVLIYFDNAAKIDIVLRVIQLLKPGGLLLTGHSESLNNMGLPLRVVQPAAYERA